MKRDENQVFKNFCPYTSSSVLFENQTAPWAS